MRITQFEWDRYATYLTENTPLSERHAEILALKKTGHSTDEISDTLTLPVDTVEDHWNDVLDQLDRAQLFVTIMRPHPGVNMTHEAEDIDDTPWSLLSSAVRHYSNKERPRIELELYHGETNAVSESYLLIEREIINTKDWATETTVQRSAHGPNGLRGTIYNDAETLDEYYLRYALLYKAGIDPTADYAPSAESVLDREILPREADAAEERALDRAENHFVE